MRVKASFVHRLPQSICQRHNRQRPRQSKHNERRTFHCSAHTTERNRRFKIPYWLWSRKRFEKRSINRSGIHTIHSETVWREFPVAPPPLLPSWLHVPSVFSDHRFIVQAQIRRELPQPRVLVTKLPGFLGLRHFHPAILGLPRVNRVLRHPEFSSHILDLPPCFSPALALL
jgi:hypothetical protein